MRTWQFDAVTCEECVHAGPFARLSLNRGAKSRVRTCLMLRGANGGLFSGRSDVVMFGVAVRAVQYRLERSQLDRPFKLDSKSALTPFQSGHPNIHSGFCWTN